MSGQVFLRHPVLCFFKQKTAYEISTDWSSDVCSSDLTSLAIGLWSLTVMGCLFVNSYLQLVIARMAAAVGESGCKPPTYSRSEERRVGKECSERGEREHEREKSG